MLSSLLPNAMILNSAVHRDVPTTPLVRHDLTAE